MLRKCNFVFNAVSLQISVGLNLSVFGLKNLLDYKYIILHVCLGVGLGVGHYSTGVDPLLLDGQTSRSPVPALVCAVLTFFSS